MKNWSVLVVFLYLLCLGLVLVPLFRLVIGDGEDWSELLGYYFAFFVPVLLIIQAVLLIIPVAIVKKRPVEKRSATASAIIGGLPLGALTASALFCLSITLLTEKGITDNYAFTSIVILPVTFWVIWGIMFYRNYKGDPKAFINRITKWLLAGSIMELLVAIPSHIISRQRGECCAPMFSLLAIAMGISIALLSFGPGIYFLFAKK